MRVGAPRLEHDLHCDLLIDTGHRRVIAAQTVEESIGNVSI